MAELQYMTTIGLTAAVFIVIMKLITTKYKIPGVSAFFAMV